MSWAQVLIPLLCVFVAYFCGLRAGRKDEQLRQARQKDRESDEADKVIDNNNALGSGELDDWLRKQSGK